MLSRTWLWDWGSQGTRAPNLWGNLLILWILVKIITASPVVLTGSCSGGCVLGWTLCSVSERDVALGHLPGFVASAPHGVSGHRKFGKVTAYSKLRAHEAHRETQLKCLVPPGLHACGCLIITLCLLDSQSYHVFGWAAFPEAWYK